MVQLKLSNRVYENDENPDSMSQYGRLQRQKTIQTNFNRQIAKFVICGLHAFSIVDEPQFKLMFVVALAEVTVFSRITLVKEISNMYNEAVDYLKIIIQHVPFISLTSDIWSSRKKSFMGMTIHWITEK